MMKKTILTFIVAATFEVTGQDVHFSQYFENPLTMNPGNAGLMDGSIRAVGSFRSQWQVVNGFTTFGLQFDQNLFKRKWKRAYIGYGINFYNDKAGDLDMGQLQIDFGLSGILKIDRESQLSLGISGGFGMNSIDQSKMQWGNQYDGQNFDPIIPSGENISFSNQSFGDVNAGIVYWWKRGSKEVTSDFHKEIKAGFSVFHLNRPKWSFYNNEEERKYMRFTVHFDGFFAIQGTNIAVLPRFLYARQGPHQEFLLGSIFRYNLKDNSKETNYEKGIAISGGVYARFATPFDAIVPTVRLEMYDFQLGLSYDINLSRFTPASSLRGGFEANLMYILPSDRYHQQPQTRASDWN